MNENFFSQEYFKYIVENGNARICSYQSSERLLTIPEMLGGYSATSIGWGAFLRCKNLVEVIIPNSVTLIGDSSFYDCNP